MPLLPPGSLKDRFGNWYTLVFARLILTRKLANQSIPTFRTTTYGYGGSQSCPSSPSKAGHFNHNPTHLVPHCVLSFPSHLVVILWGLTPGSKSAYTSETPTHSNTFTSSRLTETATGIPMFATKLGAQHYYSVESRSPSIDKTSQVSPTGTTPEDAQEGFLGMGQGRDPTRKRFDGWSWHVQKKRSFL